MDCEKYDKIALDLLYEELDELTSAAAKRHLEQCTRCRGIHTRLRATRDVGVVPLVDPPGGFEQRVLAAERLLRQRLPLRQRLGRAVSILAGYSMRPQLAMAALLLLMIGSSLIFLRARPGQRSSVTVTERGVPEAEGESIILPARPQSALTRETKGDLASPQRELALTQPVNPPAAGPPAAAAPTFAPAPAERRRSADELSLRGEAEGMAKSGAGAADLATESDDALRLDGTDVKDSANEALQHARNLQQSSGCAAAAPKFDEVNARFPGTTAAAEAMWRSAECRRLLGEVALARQGYSLLLEIPAYRERAQAALASLGDESAAAAQPARASKPAKAKASSSEAVSKPASPPSK